MSAGFNYLSPFIHDANWQKSTLAMAVVGGLVLAGVKISRRLANKQALTQAVIPSPKISAFSFIDFLVEAFVRHHDSVLGIQNRKYVPFTGSIFLFLLTSNLLGLIPGMPAITTTVWVNVGLALVVFCYFNYLGIKEHGAFGYLKHFWGPVWWLGFLIFPLEILSTVLRVLTLNLRLYWNISADHIVLDTFTDLAGHILLAVPFYALGTFVSFMQAFVFTTLTMVYILLATAHAEGAHAEDAHH